MSFINFPTAISQFERTSMNHKLAFRIILMLFIITHSYCYAQIEYNEDLSQKINEKQVLIKTKKNPVFVELGGNVLSLNIVGSAGLSKTWSNDPQISVPWDLNQKYFGTQLSFSGEITYSVIEKIRIGIGAGIVNRYDGYKYANYLYGTETNSNRYYLIVQSNINENKKFNPLLEVGIINGVMTKKYIPDIGIGGTINFIKGQNLTMGIRPYITYCWGESKDLITYDSRLMQGGIAHGPIPYPYTLFYKTFSFNLSLVINLKTKTFNSKS